MAKTERSLTEWTYTKIGDICQLVMGQSPPGYSYNKEGKGLPFFQGKNDFGDIHPTVTTWCTEPIKIAEVNDIIVSVRAPVGPANICPVNSCIGRGLAALRCQKSLNHKFLFYLLRSQEKKIARLGSGSTFSAIDKSQISNLEIPLPPLREQLKISAILSTVDEAIEKVDTALEKTERMKKGLMQELLTGRLMVTESGSLRVRESKEFKVSPIGEIPKEWGVAMLDRLFGMEYGEGLSEKERVTGNYPVFGSNGIVGYHNQFLVKGPGIIIGRKGSIGAVTWVDSDFWPIDTTYYVNLKDKSIHLRWLHFKLLMLNLSKLNMATGVPGLNRSLVYGLRLSLPPFAEQQKHVEILGDADKRLDLLKCKKQKFERIKKGLMDDLLTGKKRVNLEPIGSESQ